jgi:hypothetical protein
MNKVGDLIEYLQELHAKDQAEKAELVDYIRLQLDELRTHALPLVDEGTARVRKCARAVMGAAERIGVRVGACDWRGAVEEGKQDRSAGAVIRVRRVSAADCL